MTEELGGAQLVRRSRWRWPFALVTARAGPPARAAGPRIGFKPCAFDGRIASARLRAFLPVEALRAEGWDAGIVPAGAGARDLARSYDCVVFQKPYGPDDVRTAEALHARGVKIVVDVYDNLFYNPDGLPSVADRGRRIQRMLDVADAVTISVPELARCLTATAPTFVVTDPVDVIGLGSARRDPRAAVHRPLQVVWFGNSASPGQPFGMYFLEAVLPALEKVNRSTPLQLTVISNSRELFERHVAPVGAPTRYVEWKIDTFGANLASQDICVLPVVRNPITTYKSSNRLVAALSVGLPVVASEIPSYREFADWILIEDWVSSIRRYALDAALREEHVSGAQAYLSEKYTPRSVAVQWARPLRVLFPDVDRVGCE